MPLTAAEVRAIALHALPGRVSSTAGVARIYQNSLMDVRRCQAALTAAAAALRTAIDNEPILPPRIVELARRDATTAQSNLADAEKRLAAASGELMAGAGEALSLLLGVIEEHDHRATHRQLEAALLEAGQR